jgi:hypothetical protein
LGWCICSLPWWSLIVVVIGVIVSVTIIMVVVLIVVIVSIVVIVGLIMTMMETSRWVLFLWYVFACGLVQRLN